MKIYYYTHTGAVRRKNEDCILVNDSVMSQQSMNAPLLVQSGGRLLAVADGMGGLARGHDASRIVLEALSDAEELFTDESGAKITLEQIRNTLASKQYDAGPRSVMGTTLTAVKIQQRSVLMLHIGDTRFYRINLDTGDVRRISKDHTHVQELEDSGALTEDQARTHPHSHVLTSCIDSAGDGRPIEFQTWHKDDYEFFNGKVRYLLCSDGLWGMIPVQEFKNLATQADPFRCATELKEKAFYYGAKDNISLIVAQADPV